MRLKEWLLSDNKKLRAVSVFFLMFMSGFVGGVFGYWQGTGTPPFLPAVESVVPSGIEANITIRELIKFLEDDTTDLVEYREGFNCVEYAFVLGLKGRWEGISSEIIGVQFRNDEFGHILLAYSTSDEGWVFIDPASDTIVYPRVGGELAGKKIRGLYVLRSSWVDISEVIE